MNEHATESVMLDKFASDLNLEIVMVDDGSTQACAKTLDAIAQEYGSVLHLIHLPQNGGKGAACVAGFRKALELGFTHALQVDGDFPRHDVYSITVGIPGHLRHRQCKK